MDLRETPAQRELRAELRAYFTGLMPAEDRRRVGEQGVGGPRFREVVKRLGDDGWLGIGWPVEYGGQGRSGEEQYVFFDEGQRAGPPVPFGTPKTLGPAPMSHRSHQQKQRCPPGVL